MKLLAKLEKNTEVWFLIIVSFFFCILRIPSLVEPLWYGDEGIYEVIGIALNHGKLLYRDIWDNKPPFLYLLYAVFQSNQSLIRFVCLIAGLASVILFYFLAKKLFHKKNVFYSITAIFAILLGLPVLEGNIANAENFMMPFILGAGLLVLNMRLSLQGGITKKSHKLGLLWNCFMNAFYNKQYLQLFVCGLFLGIAFLFKVVAVFDLGAFTLFLIFIHKKPFTIKQCKTKLIELSPLYLGFLLPVLCTTFFFAYNHILSDFIHSVFLNNADYIKYEKKFHLPIGQTDVKTIREFIPQGFLLFKIILLGIFSLAIYMQRQKLSMATIFILLWLSFSIFSALFSQRHYTHYLLVVLTSFCLLIGLLFQKTKSLFLFISIFLVIAIYFLNNFSFYNKNLPYYQNFIALITNNKNITSYRSFFDEATPYDYALADFLHTHLEKNDQFFLWGNNAQLYVLANKLPPNKYIVAYHINSSQKIVDETQQTLEKTHPKFIIIMPNQELIPYRLTGYSQRLSINTILIYERRL